MPRQIIVHVPHASDVIPPSDDYLIDTRLERNIVTDWCTNDLIVGDQSVTFPFSRVYCDVERFENDPLEAVGQGIYYTKTLGGEPLRERTDDTLRQVMALYRGHHQSLALALQRALAVSPVCLVDAHSYSDYQASFTGRLDRPDICIGTDQEHSPGHLVDELKALFIKAGYSVCLDSPYAGTMIPQGFRGHRDFSALMLELNKRLYLLDERPPAVPRPSQGYERLKRVLREAMEIIRKS